MVRNCKQLANDDRSTAVNLFLDKSNDFKFRQYTKGERSIETRLLLEKLISMVSESISLQKILSSCNLP